MPCDRRVLAYNQHYAASKAPPLRRQRPTLILTLSNETRSLAPTLNPNPGRNHQALKEGAEARLVLAQEDVAEAAAAAEQAEDDMKVRAGGLVPGFIGVMDPYLTHVWLGIGPPA